MQDNQPVNQPEIDLLHFLRPVTRLLTRILENVKFYFFRLRVNAGIFLVILIIAGILGVLIRYVKAPAYKTEAIFISHVIPASIGIEMLDRLNNPNLSISRELNISAEAAGTIKEIRAKKLESINLHRTYDSLLYFNNDSLPTIEIALIITNFKFIDTIQNALIRFMDQSPYSQSRSSARKLALLALRAEIAKKLGSMDSVQVLVNNSLQFKRDYANGDPINPMDGYEATLRYNKQKIAIDQELTTMDNIELLQPFTRYEKYNYPDYLQLFLVTVCAGLLLALIVTPLVGKKPKTA